MTGLGSYRSGAGLVTVAIPKSALTTVAGVPPGAHDRAAGRNGVGPGSFRRRRTTCSKC